MDSEKRGIMRQLERKKEKKKQRKRKGHGTTERKALLTQRRSRCSATTWMRCTPDPTLAWATASHYHYTPCLQLLLGPVPATAMAAAGVRTLYAAGGKALSSAVASDLTAWAEVGAA